jgi:multiple sugar transport system permease protein
VQFGDYFKNTTIITVISLILVLFTDALAAYAFAKFKFRGKTILFWTMIGTMMLPIYATLIPTFWLFSKLKLVNTYQALILPGVIDAYGIFLLKQYMETIPDDGCVFSGDDTGGDPGSGHAETVPAWIDGRRV